VKELRPPMNADERGLKTGSLSAFIGVHLRLPVIFSHLLRERWHLISRLTVGS